MQVKHLHEINRPLLHRTPRPTSLELVSDGRLWINDPTHCILRICNLPPDTIVDYDEETGFLDLTLPIQKGEPHARPQTSHP